MSRRLVDLAKVLRSKNSGPFQVTFDILFDDVDNYQAVVDSNFFTVGNIAKLYKLEEKDVKSIVFFKKAQGIKFTLNRKVASGTCFDRDVYGAQQHAPLLNVEI